MSEKVPLEVVLRSTGIIVGKSSEAFKDLDRALKDGDDAAWLAAKTSFDQLSPETRAKIRLHAESYARLITDDDVSSKTA
jgi:hypothetical protein